MTKRKKRKKPVASKASTDSVWNAAVTACQEAVFSDGYQMHPELVALLETKKR